MKRVLKLGFVALICVLFTIAGITIKVNVVDDTLKATNIKVEIDVSEYNILTITETIDIEFLTPHHGIIRTIPLENNINREDGSTGYNVASIYDINCNATYTTSTSFSTCTIRIGDADKTVEGHGQYVLSYKYDLGDDTLKGADELYFNVIGTEWTYEIEHLQVIIHMPKEFDASKFGVSHGKPGSTNYSGVLQKITGNTIELRYDEVLKPGEAFTVRCELPQGYFKEEFLLGKILTGVIAALAAIITGILNKLLYNRFGKPDPVIQTVEFYPPENMSPPRLYNVINNNISDNSVNGLLITLASKGYLTIETPEDKSYRFIIYDKPTNELCDEEKIYYYNLRSMTFQGEDGTWVVDKDLVEYRFYNTIWEVKRHIQETAERVYEKGQWFFSAINNICGLALIFVAPIMIVMRVPIWRFKWYHWASAVLCIVTGIYLLVLSFRYRKRTKRNNELYGRALGFRDFLDVADRERLEALVEENPMYFYDILPYAYALGLTDRWMKKFEGMLVDPAEWYRGNDFDYFMHSGMRDYDRDATSRHYESSDSSDYDDSSSGWSSSSSSGGGYSGGGSGGGGSSGW